LKSEIEKLRRALSLRQGFVYSSAAAEQTSGLVVKLADLLSEIVQGFSFGYIGYHPEK
jgi:hypothetical protein